VGESEDGLESIPVDHRCFRDIFEVKGDLEAKGFEPPLGPLALNHQ